MIAEVEQLFLEKNLRLNEARVFPESGAEYWHSTVIDNRGNPISGGFGPERMHARKIAVSEFLERNTYAQLRKAPKSLIKDWGLDRHPTACGFAGGFDIQKTIARSIGEAIERWVMSLWIDQGYYIPAIEAGKVRPRLDRISAFLVEQFDEVLFFYKDITFNLNRRLVKVSVAQTMGLKDGGIFPGSSAQSNDGNYWQHALVESFRHLLGFWNNPARPNTFPDNKVHFFGKNAAIAMEQIARGTNANWPTPELSHQKVIELYGAQFFVARTIFKGWRNWSEGPLERFLY